MTTTTIFGNSADGSIGSSNGVYSVARAGSGLSTDDTLLVVGQTAGFYNCHESFIYFDTSVLDDSETIVSAVLSLTADVDQSVTDFTVQARTSAWSSGGLTTGDWVAGASLSALPLLATLSTVGFVADSATYNTFTSEAGFAGAINRTGLTEILLCSDRHSAGTTPTGNEYVRFTVASGGAADPKLVVATADVNPLRTVTSPMRW